MAFTRKIVIPSIQAFLDEFLTIKLASFYKEMYTQQPYMCDWMTEK